MFVGSEVINCKNYSYDNITNKDIYNDLHDKKKRMMDTTINLTLCIAHYESRAWMFRVVTYVSPLFRNCGSVNLLLK